jgi:subtilase family serine protease
VFLGFSGPGQPAGWYVVSGTSEAAPLFGGIVAIADQAAGHRLGLLNPSLYALGNGGGAGIVDVTSGNNTVRFTNLTRFPGTFTVDGFAAVEGYDLSSGLGTADGTRLVTQLATMGRDDERRR